MNHAAKTRIRFTIAFTVGAASLMWNGKVPWDSQVALMSSAEARIGRPLTPMSYAGVARRTTRRAVAVGVAVGAAAAAPVVVAPVVVAPICAQTVDAYGRIVTVCR